MKVSKKKSFVNQKCGECGLSAWPQTIVITPERVAKPWRLCEVCFDRIFIKKALREIK